MAHGQCMAESWPGNCSDVRRTTVAVTHLGDGFESEKPSAVCSDQSCSQKSCSLSSAGYFSCRGSLQAKPLLCSEAGEELQRHHDKTQQDF